MPSSQEILRFIAKLELGDRLHAAVGRGVASASPRVPRGPRQRTDAQVRAAWKRGPLELPTVEVPRASVIVPVYGKMAVTWGCLESLAATNAGASYELVVVDDQSPDETPHMLKQVRGVRSIHNAQNLGFIGSCNAGAAVARGATLVFLNNDTVVTDGWLSALLNTFDVHPGAGIVGARLLFPDGRLQEAGAIVFRDGNCSHVGRNRRPGESEYEYVRAVDYVSGACLAIPRALFEKVGGFDSFYAPAYYEDVDLAFQVRKQGLEVLYQPRSTVFHYEGITNGRNVRQGVKRHQLLNRERFQQRWRDELLASHAAPRHRSRYTADRRRRLRALVISDDAALAPGSKPTGLRLALSLRALGVHVAWSTTTCWPQGSAELLRSLGIEALTPPHHPSTDSVLRGERAKEVDLVWLADPARLEDRLLQLRRRLPRAQILVDADAMNDDALLASPTAVAADCAVAALADVLLTADPERATRLREALPAVQCEPFAELAQPLATTTEGHPTSRSMASLDLALDQLLSRRRGAR